MTRIFDLDHHHEAPPAELAQLLGVKGAGLAAMTSALGLAVPVSIVPPRVVGRAGG